MPHDELATAKTKLNVRLDASGYKAGSVPACPSKNPVEQPIDLFFNWPAYTTFSRVGIKA
jgi:hypothetical protein